MAITRVQGNFNGIATGIANTVGVTISAVGSGNTIVGYVTYANDATTITSVVDDKSNAYTVYDVTDDTGDSFIGASFILGNITNAPTVFTVTVSGSVQFLTIGVEEYTGVAAVADPRDGHRGNYQPTPGTGTDAITSGSITTTANGDLIYGVSLNIGNQVVSAGTGYAAETTNNTIQNRSISEDKTQSTAGSVSATFSQGSAGPTIALVTALKLPAAAPVLPPPIFTDSEIYQVRRTALIY